MKILAISGSRNRQGKTAFAVDTVLKGVHLAGGNEEIVFLPELAIERCRQCDINGYGICRTEGRCIIEDDFPSVVDKIDNADVCIFANPVYYSDLSESMKGFLDRFRRIRSARMLPPGRPGLPPLPQGGAPAIGICYAGRSGFGATLCAANLERILQMCGFDIVDMIPIRRQNLDVKLPMLEAVGRWLVTKPVSGPMPPFPSVQTQPE